MMEKPWLKFYDSQVPANLPYPDMLLPQILDDAADQFPERMGAFFFEGRVRYRVLGHHADQFAKALISLGFRKGDRLGILLANMPQAIISAFGALKAGGVAVFLDPKGDREEIQRQLNDAGVEMAVILDLILPRIDPIFPKTKMKQFIIAGVKDYLPFPRDFFFALAAKGRGIHVKIAQKPNIHMFQEFLSKGQNNSLPPSSSSPNEVAVILYTSGTSGPPRGVPLTHKNLIANMIQASAWLGNPEKGKETFLSILPFHQAFGLTLGMNLPIYLAAAALQHPQFEITQALSLIKKKGATFFPASPSMIEFLSNYPYKLEKHNISRVKVLLSVAGPLEGEILQNLERRIGRKVCEGYGLSEASPLTHANPLLGKRKIGSIGLPLPDTDARIVDTENWEKEMPPGELGELVVKGPQIMEGYWNKPEETAKVFRQGWLHTGDLARMDEEGYFYVLGKVLKGS